MLSGQDSSIDITFTSYMLNIQICFISGSEIPYFSNTGHKPRVTHFIKGEYIYTAESSHHTTYLEFDTNINTQLSNRFLYFSGINFTIKIISHHFERSINKTSC